MNVLSRLQKLRQQADRVQNLEGAGLDSRRPSLAVRLHVALDDPRRNTVPCKLGRGEQP